MLFVLALILMPGFIIETRSQSQQSSSLCSPDALRTVYAQYKLSLEKKDTKTALTAAKGYLSCADNSSVELVAELNLGVGELLTQEQRYTESISYLINAATYDTKIKGMPHVYFLLARAYEEGPYRVLADRYKERFQGKDETQKSLQELERINQLIDRIIDACARGLVLSGIKLGVQTLRQPYIVRSDKASDCDAPEIIDLYKFRHKGSDEGLIEFISTVLSRPLPRAPDFIASLLDRKQ